MTDRTLLDLPDPRDPDGAVPPHDTIDPCAPSSQVSRS